MEGVVLGELILTWSYMKAIHVQRESSVRLTTTRLTSSLVSPTLEDYTPENVPSGNYQLHTLSATQVPTLVTTPKPTL